MLPTEEIRWFFAGEIPPSVMVWFDKHVCSESAQPARIDYYLRLNENDSLGIKQRQGRIEAKQREREGGVVHLSSRAAGRLESWRKWSFDMAQTEASETYWIGVEKSRRWCLFTVEENGRVTLASTTTTLEQGCACELTEIHLTDSLEQWWSLGFEAFGGTAVDRREKLLVVARQILKQDGVPLLTAEQSYGYPKWLNLVK
jgi:hypothetical protein